MTEIVSLALHRQARRRSRIVAPNAEPAQVYLFDGVRIERRSGEAPEPPVLQSWRAGRAEER